MEIGDAERYIKEQLSGIYEESEAQNIASLAIEHISSLDRSKRLMKKKELLSPVQLEQLQQTLKRLQHHEPIQYIMNKAWFYGMELFVNNAVLIPRPETEELVDWVIKDVKASGKDVFHRNPSEADETKKMKIFDVGTGSGCIALALKKTMPKAEVWGCDVSEEALNVARRNGSSLDIRVDFQGIDFLDVSQQKQLPTVDIIVSNPPYIPLCNKEQMHSNVVEYEPHTALFVPDNDPLVFYRALAQFGKHRLHENGSLYIEIHEDLGKDVINLFKQEGYTKVELRKDMQGKERMIKIK